MSTVRARARAAALEALAAVLVYVIEDVRRGQWSALEREKRLLQTVQSDSNFCHP
jgi:hypothetical protein